MTSLALLLTESAAQHPDRPAIRHDGRVLTYTDLDEASARVAALLVSRGITAGQTVGLMLPNVAEFAVVYYGIVRAGAVVVPMNPLLKSREVAYYLSDSGARLLLATGMSDPHAATGAAEAGADLVVVDDGFAALLAGHEPRPGVAARAGDDLAVLLYTSGTTGQPKGAELTHANLRHNAAVTATTLLELTPDDVVLGCLPFFHAFGQSCWLNAALCSGACVTVIPRFSAATALEVVARDRVTVFEGVPTMFSAPLGHPNRSIDTSSLRIGVSGGAALPVEVLRGFEEAFAAPVLEGYGLSETSPVAAFNHPHRPRKPGSIGTPVDGVQMRLVDETGADVAPGQVGEIAIRGHNVMRGYRNRAEATREAIPDGWFRSGDLARQDEEGYFFIVDRKKDLIIRGRVAAYKYPRRIWVVDSLPKGPTGKILRREVTIPAEVLS